MLQRKDGTPELAWSGRAAEEGGSLGPARAFQVGLTQACTLPIQITVSNQIGKITRKL